MIDVGINSVDDAADKRGTYFVAINSPIINLRTHHYFLCRDTYFDFYANAFFSNVSLFVYLYNNVFYLKSIIQVIA